MNRQRRRESGRAQRHHLLLIQSVGQMESPIARHARIFSVAAIVSFGQRISGHEHAIAGLEPGIRRGLDDPGQVDSADQGILPQDLARAGARQRVLVVDPGKANADDDFAGAEVLQAQAFKPGNDLLAVLMDAKCLEGVHLPLRRRSPQTMRPCVLRSRSFFRRASTCASVCETPCSWARRSHRLNMLPRMAA